MATNQYPEAQYREHVVPTSPPESLRYSISLQDHEIDENVAIKKDKNNAQPPNTSLSQELFNKPHQIMIPLLFTLAFFVYYDRGGLSSALSAIQKNIMNDDEFKGGIFAAMYLFGFCLTSPVFAYLGNRYPPIKMSSIGMFVWCIGAAGTGLFSSFALLSLARLLTGIGEAGFLSFAGTIIDTIAPNESRSRWLGFFFMGIPLGYACGYGVGGVINEALGWRAIFLSEILMVIPICVLLLCIKSPENMLVIKDAKNKILGISDDHKTDLSIKIQVKRILKSPTFLTLTFGYALQTFVVGTFGVEAISYMESVFGFTSGKAGIIFGGITFFTGICGSIFGGVVLDKLKAKVDKKIRSQYHDFDDKNAVVIEDYQYVKPAAMLCALLSLIAYPTGICAILTSNFYVFAVCVAISEFFLFATQGPANNAVLWAVLYEDRPLAVALNTLNIHLLGDALAPILVGWSISYQKSEFGRREPYAYKFTFGIAINWLIFSAVTFAFSLLTMRWLHKWMKLQGLHDIDSIDDDKKQLLIND